MNIFKPCFCIALVSLISCNKDREEKVVPAGDAKAVYNDVAYGDDPLQKMDVYLPPGRSMEHTPILLMIHGGGWWQGDKKSYEGGGTDSFFNLNGYAVIYMNYRVAISDKTRYPVQLDDIDSAISFMASKRSEWQVNT